MENQTRINDRKIRMIMIPFFGIFIPNVSGLFGHITFTSHWYWIGYVYFILVSYIIWHGNRFFLFKQRERFNWFNAPVQKLMLLVFANVFYTAPVTVVMLYAWYIFAGFNQPDWKVIELVTLMNVIAVIFITHVYETVFLIRERESDLLNVERLERAKAESELQALKNQIDPHFMFNSLNTLSYLIENDKEKALLFNDNLSDIYRYILMNKEKELVRLVDELDFLNKNFSLLQIRFGNSIVIESSIDKTENYLIPPISLQLLLENAVKHNEFDSKNLLVIKLDINDSVINFTNNLKPKRKQKESSKVGLKNLSERYKLITGSEIGIASNNGTFEVKLPLLKLGEHEGTDSRG